MTPKWIPNGSREASRKGAETGGPFFAKTLLACTREQSFRNLAIVEREAREAKEPQALQATQPQREQQEGQEQERQHQEAQQRKSGKSSPSINTASVHYRLGREHHEEQQRKSDQSINTASVYYRVNRLCPCSPAARARRAVGAGSASVASIGLNMFRNIGRIV